MVRRDAASRMSGASVDQAVRLVRQAVLQDSKRNYSEAARCYRDAIVTFKELRQSRSSSHRLQSLLDTKLGGFPAQIGTTSFPCQIRDFNTFSLSELVSTGLSVSEGGVLDFGLGWRI